MPEQVVSIRQYTSVYVSIRQPGATSIMRQVCGLKLLLCSLCSEMQMGFRDIQAGAKAALLGRCVAINGLISTPEFNGCKGSAFSFNDDQASTEALRLQTLIAQLQR